MLVVDAANVVGSRPNGWWRDRARAAATLHRDLLDALAGDLLDPPLVLVLEGQARAGVEETDAPLRVVHAPGSGDDTIAALAAAAVAAGQSVSVVTADRGLRARIEQAGATALGPRWLLGVLEEVRHS